MTPYIITPKTSALSHDIADYPDGIVIPVDKPYRWTSADVIRKVKYAAIRHFGKRNLKVGHAGTLDPLATGIVIVCIGNATKLAEEFQSHDKEYIAGITFGATTPSYDLEKEIDRFFPFEHISEQSIRDVLGSFIGEQNQIAPLFSAKNVDGVRAYELARKLYRQQQNTSDAGQFQDIGSSLDSAAESLLRVSRINISALELLNFSSHPETTSRHPEDNSSSRHPEGSEATKDPSEAQTRHCEALSRHCEEVGFADRRGNLSGNPSSRINVANISNLALPQAEIRITCSKGTYIRAFARDLGESLASGAFLNSLRRTRSGIFTIQNAVSVDTAISLFQ